MPIWLMAVDLHRKIRIARFLKGSYNLTEPWGLILFIIFLGLKNLQYTVNSMSDFEKNLLWYRIQLYDQIFTPPSNSRLAIRFKDDCELWTSLLSYVTEIQPKFVLKTVTTIFSRIS